MHEKGVSRRGTIIPDSRVQKWKKLKEERVPFTIVMIVGYSLDYLVPRMDSHSFQIVMVAEI